MGEEVIRFGIPVATAVLAIVLVAVLSVSREIPLNRLTQDIFAVAQLSPLTSLLSNLGALGWTSALALLAFTGAVLRDCADRRAYHFICASAVLTMVLLFDDAFMFHDHWLRRLSGKVDFYFYTVLGIAVLSYLFTFRDVILSTRYGPLIVACELWNIDGRRSERNIYPRAYWTVALLVGRRSEMDWDLLLGELLRIHLSADDPHSQNHVIRSHTHIRIMIF